MECSDVRFSQHAFKRMFERQVTPEAVTRGLDKGEIIASYPDDQPLPSYLILWFEAGSPVHAVVARSDENALCVVVTVYRPTLDLWYPDFRIRRDL